MSSHVRMASGFAGHQKSELCRLQAKSCSHAQNGGGSNQVVKIKFLVIVVKIQTISVSDRVDNR